MYTESVPVIEKPLSDERTIKYSWLQSWGGTIRIFPGVPDAWKDVTIDRMRAEGAFLVSASRRGGKLQWVRIKSEAGEPCRVECFGKTQDLSIKKGESKMLFPPGEAEPGEVVVEPVAAQADRVNTFGLP
jgi:hypothetical protein